VSDRLIVDLYLKDGKTQAQIAAIVGLTHQGVNKILAKRAIEPMQPGSKSSKKRSRRPAGPQAIENKRRERLSETFSLLQVL